MTKIVLLKEGQWLFDEKTSVDDMEIIAETDKAVGIYNHIIIDGENYLASHSGTKNGVLYMGVRPFEPKEEKETEYERNLTCPYCGHIDHDSCELSDDEGETECGRCGAELKYYREVEITYSAEILQKPKIVEI